MIVSLGQWTTFTAYFEKLLYRAVKIDLFRKGAIGILNYYVEKPLLGRPAVQLTPSIKRSDTSIKRNFSFIFVTQHVTLNRLSLERKQCPNMCSWQTLNLINTGHIRGFDRSFINKITECCLLFFPQTEHNRGGYREFRKGWQRHLPICQLYRYFLFFCEFYKNNTKFQRKRGGRGPPRPTPKSALAQNSDFPIWYNCGLKQCYKWRSTK